MPSKIRWALSELMVRMWTAVGVIADDDFNVTWTGQSFSWQTTERCPSSGYWLSRRYQQNQLYILVLRRLELQDVLGFLMLSLWRPLNHSRSQKCLVWGNFPGRVWPTWFFTRSLFSVVHSLPTPVGVMTIQSSTFYLKSIWKRPWNCNVSCLLYRIIR